MRWMPDTQELIRTALQSLTGFFHDCCTAADEHKRKTAPLLAYWLRDYVRFLRKEGEARIYKRFQRGDIVKVHLGYRVGSEEGGLHYAVVVSSTDSVKSPTLVVIPLTSVKSQKRVERLRYSEVFLGDELWQKMYEKSQVSPNNALSKELEKMKLGSIALVNQIVTISKLRIYSLKRDASALNGIRFSTKTMQQIDEKMRQILFLQKLDKR